ncbi:MAG: hypothetical protein ABR587_17645 [Candidatus Binatia bacterium]
MNRWKRGLRGTLLSVVLGTVFSACGGGGADSVLVIHFGIGGDGACQSVTIDIDLAGSVIEQGNSGDVNCVLDAALDQDGCEIEFTQPGGDLRAVVSGCTIPPAADLFRCGFREADISRLQESAFAQCSCQLPGCDTTPSACVGEAPALADCEAVHCDNGDDDDSDGLTDCADPDCSDAAQCLMPTTTTSLASLSTTTSISTSTTQQPPEETCTLVFRLVNEVTIGSLQWTTDYSSVSGGFLGVGDTVECASLVEGALAAFNDRDLEKFLESGLISVDGFAGPRDLAECTFRSLTDPLPSDFVIGDVEAATPDLALLEPAPAIVVKSVSCDVANATTTTTYEGQTTTTVEEGTTTTTTTTTTTLPPDGHAVLFSIDTASAPLGSIMFTVDYTDTEGGFLGSAGAVSCSSKVANALFAANDRDADRELVIGFIFPEPPHGGPGDLVRCTFQADEAPMPGDFVVTINEATDSAFVPVTVTIGVSVSSEP